MTISLSDAGKRFNRDWIFRHFNYSFTSGNSYAIVGPNGSGKSTLLQVISGAIALSEGSLVGSSELSMTGGHGSDIQEEKIDENIYRQLAIAAPYLEVVEEMTAAEFLAFHQNFKPLLPSLSVKEIISIIGLESAANKQIRYYSSGMKQRIKLAQAIFSAVPMLLLDEPCTNLDVTGIRLYQQLIDTYCKERLVIVSSNDEAEYGFCRERIDLLAYKQ